MTTPHFALFGVLATLALAAPALAQESHARTIDGDTLKLAGMTIRLFGIDAPEQKQTCTESVAEWPCGRVATEALKAMTLDKVVHCDPRDKDRYGRSVAICFVGAADLGEAMVRRGWALSYRQFSKMYVPAEDAARDARAGMWNSQFTPPQEWRREQRRHRH